MANHKSIICDPRITENLSGLQEIAIQCDTTMSAFLGISSHRLKKRISELLEEDGLSAISKSKSRLVVGIAAEQRRSPDSIIYAVEVVLREEVSLSRDGRRFTTDADIWRHQTITGVKFAPYDLNDIANKLGEEAVRQVEVFLGDWADIADDSDNLGAIAERRSIDFELLSKSLPKSTVKPCKETIGEEGELAYMNQCAIRMSIALNAEGSYPVNKETYSDPLCKHGDARGAQSLADWLWNNFKPAFKYKPSEAEKKMKGKTGIIFLKDCFEREGENVNEGDHIDLWNKSSLQNEETGLIAQSKEVWFFTV